MRNRAFGYLFLAAGLLLFASCGGSTANKNADSGAVTLVFKHWKVPGGEASMRTLVDRFEEENPGIRVVDEYLPASTDQQHQFYVTQLSAGSSDFDVFALDVIWKQPHDVRIGADRVRQAGAERGVELPLGEQIAQRLA